MKEEEEITALAREYAEKIYNDIEVEHINKQMIDSLAEGVKRSWYFLLRRFCLVEKAKLGEAYWMIKNKYDNAESSTDMDLALAQKEILDFIIPEITKEGEE